MHGTGHMDLNLDLGLVEYLIYSIYNNRIHLSLVMTFFSYSVQFLPLIYCGENGPSRVTFGTSSLHWIISLSFLFVFVQWSMFQTLKAFC